MVGWAPGPGVVELPYGRRVRGRGLRAGPEVGPAADVTFCLLGREPAATGRPIVWIQWPDFRRPADEGRAGVQLLEAFDRCVAERVEFVCRGGRGRTGCALAVLAVLGGVRPGDAVAWVRAAYDPRAVETPWQRRWIRGLDPDRLRARH